MPLLRGRPRAVLRIRARNPQIADQVAVQLPPRPTSPPPTRHARLRPQGVRRFGGGGQADFARLRARLSSDDIWDIGAISAFFAMSNRLASTMKPAAQRRFYLMGRLPKGVTGARPSPGAPGAFTNPLSKRDAKRAEDRAVAPRRSRQGIGLKRIGLSRSVP